LDDDIKNGAPLSVIEADFEKLDHVNGKEVAGLLKRRKAEFQMFAYGIYS
jgi:GH24 family phage-related lysozyme (muramidase)